ncbi:MAG: hypothetical protein U0X20_23720 [Caldilineaceae bacterium]
MPRPSFKGLTNKFVGAHRKRLAIERAKRPDLVFADPAHDLARRLGDERLAKRVAALQQQYPVASVPELVVFDWLRSQGMAFDFQVQLFGGRGTRGGLIPDFIIYGTNGGADVWQVQGQYWHALRQKGFADEHVNLLMLGRIINGARVGRVVELWEGDIYHNRPLVFLLALGGMEMR